uniref:Amino acid transporter n=1 Tax=Globodera pallida TaxID=36090 RepID=A0A183BHH0_GLOPA
MENLILVLTLISVFVGIGAGFFARQFNPSRRTIDMIGFPGELFMNVLKLLILPLIAASLVSGLSQLDARQSGRIGAFALPPGSLLLSHPRGGCR